MLEEVKHGAIDGIPFAPGDSFGNAVALLGDLDGAGGIELVVGARNTGTSGAVYILFMSPSGAVLGHSTLDGSDSDEPSLGPIDLYGAAIAPIGDLQADGILDVAVSAPNHDAAAAGATTDSGAVFLLLLDASGTPIGHHEISADTGIPLEDSDHFGRALAALPDFDGNGVQDLVVGAPGDDDGGDRRGAIYLLRLASDGSALSSTKISQLSGGLTGPLPTLGRFGAAVTCLGDLDGDGTVDLAVGSPNDPTGAPDTGAVWILFLNPDGTVRDERKLTTGQGGLPTLPSDGIRFGEALAAPGDLDGDGVVDLVVGTNHQDGPGQDAGGLWVLFLETDGQVRAVQQIAGGLGLFGGPLSAGDEFGIGIAALGDLDGDGAPELAVGAQYDDDAGLDAGALWRLDLNRSTWADLGYALAGELGEPELIGSGSLIPGTQTCFALSRARPSSLATLIVGAQAIFAPFKGGVLVPSPDVFLTNALVINSAGDATLCVAWPDGVPAGFTAYFQAWQQDAAAAAGWAASNAVSAFAP